MENLHNAPFSTRSALTALLTASLWGLALVVFLPMVGMLLVVYTVGERVLRRKGRMGDEGAAMKGRRRRKSRWQ